MKLCWKLLLIIAISIGLVFCLCQMLFVVLAVLAVAAAQVYYTPYSSGVYRSSPYVYSTGYVSPYTYGSALPYAYSYYR